MQKSCPCSDNNSFPLFVLPNHVQKHFKHRNRMYLLSTLYSPPLSPFSLSLVLSTFSHTLTDISEKDLSLASSLIPYHFINVSVLLSTFLPIFGFLPSGSLVVCLIEREDQTMLTKKYRAKPSSTPKKILCRVSQPGC